MRRMLLLSMFLVIFGTVFGREIKIAYFDSEKLRTEWDDWKDAQAKFDQDVVKWQEQAKQMEDSLSALMEEYQKQQLLLSDEKRQEKEMIIQQKQKEYQDFLSSIFGDNGKAAARNAELTKPLYDQINTALSKLADREGYSVVFDAAASGIAYIDPTLDITENLLKELKMQ